MVDGDNRVLNIDDEPIAGLFATGNTSGPFFGGVDYPMNFPGLSPGSLDRPRADHGLHRGSRRRG